MKIRINRVHFPVTVLGPGRRLGIWLQGCSIGCAGCVSRDTWSINAGQLILIPEFVDKCRSLVGDSIDGITITGGEPFEQAAALAALLDSLADWRTTAGFDVLCYSGFPLKRLIREHSSLLRRLDALIPEPFVNARPTEEAWIGSSNQTVITLSQLGVRRYASVPTGTPKMQVTVEDGAVWFVGIPRRGDLERLRSLVADRGLTLEDVSWIS